MDTLFTKGTVIELEDNSKIAVIDSYCIDTKNIKVVAITENLDICILNFNLDTNKLSKKYYYDTIKIVAELRKY